MEDKGRLCKDKMFSQVYFRNSNNNFIYVPYVTDGLVTLSLYKTIRPNPARSDG